MNEILSALGIEANEPPRAYRPRVPAGSGPRATKLWRSVVGEFDLAEHELAILTNACAVLDRIAELRKSLAEDGSPVMGRGSQGQQVIEPRLAEIRSLELAFNQHIKALDLPMGGSEEASGPVRVTDRNTSRAKAKVAELSTQGRDARIA